MPHAASPRHQTSMSQGSDATEEEGLEGLNASAHAFFFDVDGTLLDIADHPDGVIVPADLAADLNRLLERAGGAVAFVSGRTVERLDAIFHPLRLPAAGAHGAEMRIRSDAETERISPQLSPAIRAQVLRTARELGDLLVEDKGASLAIHYRSRADAKQELGHRLEAIAELAADPLTVLPGHMVFELKHSGRDKGVAIEALLGTSPFHGRRPVFIGDDVTDEAGFAAVRRHGGLSIAVGRPFENVDVVLAGPANVRALVHRLSL
ncbi:trehalose-phosphatase [Aquabacter sp. L1I39]|uniref:trehalose-phosphatase n=1 Tax=Aquabacter sp. L1I39 TaxID=2820278 RepID=UPI001ADAEB5D|nr:trehalose-phosphatase [Aquabacter sp. L1I39]QTL03782.1 trehalose-phosphatase [Aquabacter sp. L1I39]